MIQFILAIVALLLTPGPTNTLLAVSGSSAGLRRSLPLVIAEITGYLLVIVPLVTFAGPLLQEWPRVAVFMKLCSAAWVLLLACRLWSIPAENQADGGVTFYRVFITTCLNPKAIIIGLVLIPSGNFEKIAPYLAIFSATVVCVALVWISTGAFLIRNASRTAPWLVRRVASAFLVVFSAVLAASTFGAI